MTSKHVLLVCDADRARGSGHVMRMITLGSALNDLGATVSLSTHAIPSSLHELAMARSLNVIPRSCSQGDENLASDLQVGDWAAIVFDGYDFSPLTFSELHSSGQHVIVIDDNGDHSAADCSIIVNPNLHASEDMYAAIQTCHRFLLGAEYAMIRKDIRHQRLPEFEQRDGIFLGLGGTDPLDLSTRVNEALVSRFSSEIRRAKGVLNAAITSSSEMGELMARSRVGIIAFGTTTWEALYLGLPIVGLIVADNQSLVAESVKQLDLADVFDCRQHVAVDQIASAVTDLYGNIDLLASRSAAGQRIVDGLGASRVAEEILSS